MDVPQSFKFKPQQGIDSEGGEITNDTITFSTEFGYYTDILFQTPQEYLDKHSFRFDAMGQFMKPNVTYDDKNNPKIEVLTIRPSTLKDSDKIHFFGGSDYIAICKHDQKIFKWPVRLPANIKRHTVQIDTFNHMYRRLVLPKNGIRGETAIYVRDKRFFEKSRGSYYAIVIGADSLSEKQQALALKIFKTLRGDDKNFVTQ